MEGKKYYTPEIEEFHVGFEYCITTHPVSMGEFSPYVKREFDHNTFEREFDVDTDSSGEIVKIGVPSCIKVKYLDREDIQSMGFQTYKDEQGNPNVVYERELDKSNIRGNDLVHILHNHVSKWVGVFIGDSETPYSDWETRFTGTIKNKSELKKLLKQLGIC